MLLVQGIMKSDMGMIFAGAFFAFGAFTFVLAALTVKGGWRVSNCEMSEKELEENGYEL